MMTQVWERLYIGGLKDAERLSADNRIGITTVVSLCEEEVSRTPGLTYVRVPIADARPISSDESEQIIATIAQHIRRGTVLLMCAAGMSRSPIMAARRGCTAVDS